MRFLLAVGRWNFLQNQAAVTVILVLLLSFSNYFFFLFLQCTYREIKLLLQNLKKIWKNLKNLKSLKILKIDFFFFFRFFLPRARAVSCGGKVRIRTVEIPTLILSRSVKFKGRGLAIWLHCWEANQILYCAR